MFVLHAAKLLIDRGVASGGAVGAIAPSIRKYEKKCNAVQKRKRKKSTPIKT